ncbi:hypothetical protein [Thiomonas sp.]
MRRAAGQCLKRIDLQHKLRLLGVRASGPVGVESLAVEQGGTVASDGVDGVTGLSGAGWHDPDLATRQIGEDSRRDAAANCKTTNWVSSCVATPRA